MRRWILVPTVALLGVTLVSATTATATASAAATPKPPSKSYTVTRTYGPYNSAAQIGQVGSVPDGEGVTAACAPGESIIAGATKINRKTTHGTTARDVLTLDTVGAFWDPEVDALKWGTFVNATGKSGWNSVTITLTCRRR
jgi:hypothetical protein